ncbi:hypothetical protein C7M84_017636 [Penaeus vannamei]|uniref:Uncharacterized protein n=1 Tax=Penaeus vannamei TaxID=6689 RepID=A0A423SJU3_PENVA|nr:hypothetical protein C7M84_017636 [Penaeus vannamei]
MSHPPVLTPITLPPPPLLTVSFTLPPSPSQHLLRYPPFKYPGYSPCPSPFFPHPHNTPLPALQVPRLLTLSVTLLPSPSQHLLRYPPFKYPGYSPYPSPFLPHPHNTSSDTRPSSTQATHPVCHPSSLTLTTPPPIPALQVPRLLTLSFTLLPSPSQYFLRYPPFKYPGYSPCPSPFLPHPHNTSSATRPSSTQATHPILHPSSLTLTTPPPIPALQVPRLLTLSFTHPVCHPSSLTLTTPPPVPALQVPRLLTLSFTHPVCHPSSLTLTTPPPIPALQATHPILHPSSLTLTTHPPVPPFKYPGYSPYPSPFSLTLTTPPPVPALQVPRLLTLSFTLPPSPSQHLLRYPPFKYPGYSPYPSPFLPHPHTHLLVPPFKYPGYSPILHPSSLTLTTPVPAFKYPGYSPYPSPSSLTLTTPPPVPALQVPRLHPSSLYLLRYPPFKYPYSPYPSPFLPHPHNTSSDTRPSSTQATHPIRHPSSSPSQHLLRTRPSSTSGYSPVRHPSSSPSQHLLRYPPFKYPGYSPYPSLTLSVPFLPHPHNNTFSTLHPSCDTFKYPGYSPYPSPFLPHPHNTSSDTRPSSTQATHPILHPSSLTLPPSPSQHFLRYPPFKYPGYSPCPSPFLSHPHISSDTRP